MTTLGIKTLERHGVTFTVMVTADRSTHPSEFDVYTPADKMAFDAGRWAFVTVKVTADLSGGTLPLPTHMATALTGVEYGRFPDRQVTFTDLIDNHPVPALVGDIFDGLRALARHLSKTLPPPPPVAPAAGQPCRSCGMLNQDCLDQIYANSAQRHCCGACGLTDSHGIAAAKS